MSRHPDPSEHLPLTPVVLHTLLSLVDGDLHGYAIAREVEERTEGRQRMGPGTLYGTLHRIRDLGFIQECAGDSDRRRTYRLTDLGARVLQAEAERLQGDVRLLRAKKLIRGR